MIPVTVIGGYLGAGKTTLINGLLAGDHGLALAILVNDFGAINIDAKLIAAHDGDTIALSNGCVCCTIADALGDALDRVLTMDPAPDHIVIEASGVANPTKIAMYGQGWPGLRLDGVVVVVDGESIQVRAKDKFVGTTIHQQLAAADIVILTKTDVLTDIKSRAVHDWLKGEVPNCPIVTAIRGDLPAQILLGTHGTANYSAGNPAGIPVGESLHQDAYCAVPFETYRAMRRDNLTALIEALPDSVLRAKGLVHLADDPEHAYILQLTGSRFELEQGPAWNGKRRQTHLILIGPSEDIDATVLTSSLMSACA